MRTASNGRRSAVSTVTRFALLSLGLAATLALAACTTTEGTNAFTDFETFEREVMTSTLAGVGIIDKQNPKEETVQRRAPLVIPKDTRALPRPQEPTLAASLPDDSDRVRIDTTGISEDDLRRLRNARVVDLRTLSGRPLTEAETRQLTARMTAARLKSSPRPLYLPPEKYFTTVNGTDLVCAAADGTLVPIADPRCPDDVRKALSSVRVRNNNPGAAGAQKQLFGSGPPKAPGGN